MATLNKPQPVGLTDPNTLRKTEAQLAQAAIIANGKSTISDGEAIFVNTTVRATAGGVALTTSAANNQPGDIVTVYNSQGNTFVSAIDQTIQQTIVNKTGVSAIIAGDNITISSTGTNGTGAVTINSTGGSGNTGNITFNGDNVESTNNIVNIVGSNYAQLQSGDSYMWVESNYANIEVNGNTWSFTDGGNLNLPDGGGIWFNYGYIDQDNSVEGDALRVSGGNSVIIYSNEDGSSWLFDAGGNLTLPSNTSSINYANGQPYGGTASTGNWVFDGNDATVSNPGYPHLYGGPSGGPEFTYLEEAGNTASYSQTMYINNEDGFYVSLANGDYRFSFAIDGNTYLPSNVILDNGTDGNIDSTGNINITSNGNTSTFDTTGNLSVPGSGYFAGQNLYVGEGANTLTQYGASTLVVSANDTAYIQAVITNVSDVGSADWVAYGHHGTDAGGWVDMGFTSSGFNDANYTITKPGSGYIFAHGFDIATQPVVAGDGSLVLATGEQGNVKDIIFGTGGFLESNEFMRISDSNNQLEFYDHGNITGVGNISARGFVNGSPSPTANSAIGYYTIDNSGQTVALAAAGYVDIPNFSGMLIVDDITSGTVAVWICGGANTVQVSITSTAIHPTLGTMAQNGSGYRWTNNGFGGPFTFTIIRTRNTA